MSDFNWGGLLLTVIGIILPGLWLWLTKTGQRFWKSLGRVDLPDPNPAADEKRPLARGVRLAVVIGFLGLLVSLLSLAILVFTLRATTVIIAGQCAGGKCTTNNGEKVSVTKNSVATTIDYSSFNFVNVPAVVVSEDVGANGLVKAGISQLTNKHVDVVVSTLNKDMHPDAATLDQPFTFIIISADK